MCGVEAALMGWKQGGSLEFGSLVELGVLVAFRCFTKKGCRLVVNLSTASQLFGQWIDIQENQS